MAVAELLRETRLRRGLTLEQLAHETKIGVDRLSAFERDELPPDGSFYARARLRAYAQALGLDYRVVLEQLNQELLAAPPVVPETPPPERRFDPLHFALPAASVVLIVLIVSVWFRPSPSLARAASRVAPASISKPTPPPARLIVDREVSVARSPVENAPAIVTASTVVEPEPVPVATSGVLSPPAVTSLVITSTPDGASVTVDGIRWGTTPVTIRHLPEGHRRIRVTSDGYASVERVFDVQSEQVNRVALRLDPVEPDVEPTP
jgi:cytoskeletal protein RodZ